MNRASAAPVALQQLLPIRDVLVFAGAARSVGGAEAVEVVVPVLAWDSVARAGRLPEAFVPGNLLPLRVCSTLP